MSETNGNLTAEQILESEDLDYEQVEVPEWGGHVLVWTLPMKELEDYQQAISTAQEKLKRRPPNMMSLLVVKCVRDKDGNRLFKDDQAPKLGNKSSSAMMRLFNVAVRMNRMTQDDIEELAGNLEGAPSVA